MFRNRNTTAAGLVRRLLDGLTLRRVGLIVLGAMICTFGIHNIHQQTGITEGGVMGLMLLVEHWLGVSPAFITPVLDITCYLLAFKYLGGRFIKISAVSTLSVSLFYKVWELFPPMLPDLSDWPLLAGPQGLENFWAVMRLLAGPLPYPVIPTEMPPEGLWFEGGATLSAVPTRHRVPSQGYCFRLPRAGRFDPQKARALGVPLRDWKRLQQGESLEVGGRTVAPGDVCGPARRGIKVVFSGDTAPCPALEDAARDADLLICDATYADEALAPEAARYGHSTFRQTAALAARAGARRLWLAHYSPRIEDPEAALPLAQAVFPAAECGFDGKSVTLPFTES